MYLKVLIDGIVRQTTVLLAQLSTASGARSPLTKIADQVFLQLAKEIEAQGVAKPVVADMFGLALRSYQKKTRRLVESVTENSQTLWEVVYAFIAEAPRARQRVLQRFQHDGEREVGAVLNDLMSSGLIFQTGSGARAVYGATSEQTREHVQRAGDVEAVANVIWMKVFHCESKSKAELSQALHVDEALLDSALAELRDTGRVVEREDGQLEACNLVIPTAQEGKEAAMLDHFQAVAKVLARKAQAASGPAEDGGATFSFSIYPGHPHETEVRSLLNEIRQRVDGLWDKVAGHNRSINLERDSADQVTFYLGQVTQNRET
jgi:hypothetical protein